jgi:CO/xanthine dehydrogenase FAD-binding subunit
VNSFEYAAPKSVENAIQLLAADPLARVLAGGTDLLVQLRSGRKHASAIVDIKRIQELNELRYDEAGLTLGAAVPCYRIYNDLTISRAYPALAQVAGLIGGTQIQGRAAIGGNLCNSAPSADAVPVLIALRVICDIAGPAGRREIKVDEFCTGPGSNVLRTGELLVALKFPPPAAHSAAQYLRFIPRNEMDIAVAGAAASVVLHNGHFTDARIALASVGPTPLFVREAGEALVDRPVNAASMARAADLACAAAQPITDKRGSADYRRHICRVLTRRALEAAVQIARETR